MGRYKDDGRMVSAIAAEAKVRDWERKALELLQKKINDDAEVKAVHKELELAEKRVESLAKHLDKAKLSAAKKIDMSSTRRAIDRLRTEAQQANASVTAVVHDHIERMCRGIDYGGPLTIVWFNRDFVILRKPGRTGWGGIGVRSYTPATNALYDLKANAKKFGMSIEPVKETRDGRLSLREKNEWIKYATKK
jgi:hypothetical protein